MWLTRTAIQRPLIVLIVFGTILAFGLVSWTRLGVELLPAIEFPLVVVTTAYPGAGPEAVDTLVTRKVEDAVASLNEIKNIQSTSSEGVSSVTILFTERASKDSAQDVERRVSAIRSELPTDAKTPSIDKFDPNSQPIIELALGGTRDLGQLQRLGDDLIKKRLEGLPGVARVTLLGGLTREIQVQASQAQLQARGLSILQLTQALQADNLNVPAGSVTQRDQDWTVRLNSQVQNLQDLHNVLIANTPTGAVRLKDVATVVDTYKQATVLQRSNGQPALGVLIYKQASANTVSTSEAVSKGIAALKQDLPNGVTINEVFDASTYIKGSVADVQTALLLAVLLTGLVLLVFLHTLRSTAIVLLAIPTSLIATFGMMKLLGLTFNFMSLMGLALTVGILVDDSIVVLENIARHLHLGEKPKEAAINGRSEIGMAAIAITLVDVVVFTPIAFMTGAVGQYFREFGLVIATATLFSLFVSFTLTPLLASRWLKGGAIHARVSHHPLAMFGRVWDAGYEYVLRAYRAALGFSLHHRWIVLVGAIASFAGGIALVALGVLSSEFMPRDDGGQVQVTIELPPGTALNVTNAAAASIEEKLMAVPEIETVFTSVGVGGDFFAAGQARFANMYVQLKDKKHRQRSNEQVANDVRDFGRGVPGMTLKSTALSTLGGGGGGAIQVRIQGEDQQVLAALARQVADVVRKVPGTVDISDGGVVGQPEMVVNIDRERATDFGLTPGQVASVLRTGLAGSVVGTFRPSGSKGWDISVLLNPDDRTRLDHLNEIPILTPSGSTIRLGQVAQVASVTGPTQISRRDRQRSVTVSAGLDGTPSGDVSQRVQAGIDAIKVPAGYKVSQGGDAQDQGEAFLQIFQALGLSVLLMYALMALLFESLLFPFIVMLSLPLALVGAFGLLALTGNTLNLMSMIGMILLTGLVGKNAILLVDYTNHLRHAGMARNAALLEAGPTRLRPILMTTFALILAMLPLAMRVGEGGEWRAPLAVTVIGGLITSTFLTLLVIPAVYTIVDDTQHGLSILPRLVRRVAGWRPRPRRVSGPMPAPAAGGSE